MPQLHLSSRGHALIYTGPAPVTWPNPGRPILTVENYMKWYTLALVLPGGKVEDVCFPGADERFPEKMVTKGQEGYRDHIPNPIEVSRMAEHCGWDLCDISYEVMIGRWLVYLIERFPVQGEVNPYAYLGLRWGSLSYDQLQPPPTGTRAKG